MKRKALETALQDYVTSTEAAALLGVTPQHIRLLIRDGRLDALKVGRNWIVSKRSITEYQRTKSPKGRPPSRDRTKFPIDN